MTGETELSGVWAPLLLADRSPILRSLVLRDLLDRDDDDHEAAELEAFKRQDPLAAELFEQQKDDGSWPSPSRGGSLQVTASSILRLGYLGFGPEETAVQKGAEFLFSRQDDDGSWPLNNYDPQSERYSNYSMIPLQTSMPLRALASCDYGTDPRSEKAYEWLLGQRLNDGAWPSGRAAGNYAGVAGYRRIPHSRWGCRTNTTAALICLAMHPARKNSPEAKRALDLLLGRESFERGSLGFETARIIGVEPARGLFTYFARFDAALMLDLSWRVGASIDDRRIAKIVQFAESARGSLGIWTYQSKPQASRWISFDLLRSLRNIDSESDWISLEPATPFSPYPARKRRF